MFGCIKCFMYHIPPPTLKYETMRHDPSRWCKYYKIKGHRTYDCYQLKNEIEHLIQEGHIRKYIQGGSHKSWDGSKSKGKDPPESPRYRKFKDKGG